MYQGGLLPCTWKSFSPPSWRCPVEANTIEGIDAILRERTSHVAARCVRTHIPSFPCLTAGTSQSPCSALYRTSSLNRVSHGTFGSINTHLKPMLLSRLMRSCASEAAHGIKKPLASAAHPGWQLISCRGVARADQRPCSVLRLWFDLPD